MSGPHRRLTDRRLSPERRHTYDSRARHPDRRRRRRRGATTAAPAVIAMASPNLRRCNQRRSIQMACSIARPATNPATSPTTTMSQRRSGCRRCTASPHAIIAAVITAAYRPTPSHSVESSASDNSGVQTNAMAMTSAGIGRAGGSTASEPTRSMKTRRTSHPTIPVVSAATAAAMSQRPRMFDRSRVPVAAAEPTSSRSTSTVIKAASTIPSKNPVRKAAGGASTPTATHRMSEVGARRSWTKSVASDSRSPTGRASDRLASSATKADSRTAVPNRNPHDLTIWARVEGVRDAAVIPTGEPPWVCTSGLP